MSAFREDAGILGLRVAGELETAESQGVQGVTDLLEGTRSLGRLLWYGQGTRLLLFWLGLAQVLNRRLPQVNNGGGAVTARRVGLAQLGLGIVVGLGRTHIIIESAYVSAFSD